MELGSVQGADNGLGGLIWDIDETKAAAAVSLTVEADAGVDRFCVRADEFSQLGGSDLKGQVAEI